MVLRKYINRIEQLDQLIRLESTGNPEECAKKLNISKRSLYSLIDELKKDFKCPIIYSRHKRSYIYTKEGTISGFHFKSKYKIKSK
ncbi:hypothetical protein AAY42_07930 [Flagellimonas eckloniae]|uniref:Helix-turn-helix type 11 domain-containing protein n=1 Tax=Flagellimonas eckloniae TaxID=346185 RepID=A0A0Q1H7Z5_9FLAO|nr:hypothetical protein AAY42_07930 [Allomuricauda eckloniae]